jgi:hypothetical protein
MHESGMRKRRPMRDRIFVSYSLSDKKWLDKLLIHLKPMVRDEGLALWTDRDIAAGSNWEREIGKALNTARVAVLLVSPNFMASDFIARVELPSLLNAAQGKGLTVLWVPVSDTRYKNSGFARYQASINPSKPLDAMTHPAQKKALNQVAEEIEKAWHVDQPMKRGKGKVMNGRSTAAKVETANRSKPNSKAHHPQDPSTHPDADHCVNQFIDRVGGGSDEQTEILRCMLRKVMIDGLQPEDTWEMLNLDLNMGRRLWFIAVKQFTAHFNRFVNRLLEFREAIQAPP